MQARIYLAGTLLLLLASPRSASAQDAIALFEQGRALAGQGRWAEACPLFAEAHRVQKEAIGITLNLAECYEHVGKTASAWSAFREAEFLAKNAHDADRAQYAHDHGTAIEPSLSRLKIEAQPTPGLMVRRDDQDVGAGILGAALPVDPGTHTIEATAPGHLVWSTSVVIGSQRDQQTVTIPVLSRAAGATGESRRVAGLVVASVGVVTLAVGGALGGLAISKNNASKADCAPSQPDLCRADGVSLRQTAGTLANASTGAFVAGGAAVAAGVVVFATGSSRSAQTTGGVRRLEASPVAGVGVAGLLLRGEW